MKVLMTADAAGGVWTYACELIRGLAPRGVRFALATMGEALPEDRRAEARELPGTELHESTWRLEWMDDPWEDVAAAGDWLLDLESRAGADLVHLNGFAHGALPWRSPALVVTHSCVETWWRAVRGRPAPLAYARYRRAVREGLAGADAVVTPTAAQWEAMRAAYRLRRPVQVIPNGVDPGPFRSPEPDRRGASFFLAVGRLWDEGKNLSILERVAPRLPWPVALAGAEVRPGAGGGDEAGGDGTGGASRRPPGTGLPPGAHRLGRLDPKELRGWYAAAPVLAHPARYEPFGLVPLEAALAGCALVLGDLPTLREVWGDAAEWVDPGDEEGLVGALRALAGEPERRRSLGEAARRTGLTLHRDRMADAYLELYRRLAGRPRPAASVATGPASPFPGP